jgi:radical SAM family RiPP maturation amino acid epimerase
MFENSFDADNSLNNIQKKLSITIKGEKLNEIDFLDFCQIKRFFERWTADKKFRDCFLMEPYKSLDLYGLNLCTEDTKPLWDKDFVASTSQNKKHSYFNVPGGNLLQEREELNANLFTGDSRFRAWRDRQINRCKSQFHPQYYDSIGHYPVCFELSKGCSIGCWFCGISAPKLEDIFLYNEENSRLWREVLELIKNYTGDDAGSGFCYWASDPLDNPDYENFCVDFHEILGKFPYTSTAQAHKYPERVKNLLALSIEKGRRDHRFSILSLKVLNQIHSQFTPEELSTIDMAFQNPEALSMKAATGKASGINNENEEDIQSSIACVTGFLLNMVEKTVKMISPCPASQEWPDGYIIFAEGKFSDITELKALIENMIAAQSLDETTPDNYPVFRGDLEYKVLNNGFQLSTRFITYKFNNYPYIKELGGVLYEGSLPIRDIVPSMEKIGLPQSDVYYLLNKLLNKGVITSKSSHKGNRESLEKQLV